MKNRSYFSILSSIIGVYILTSIILISPPSVRALGIAQDARRWVCLDHNEDFTGSNGHNTQLSAGSPAPLGGVTAYVFVCIGGSPDGGGGSCTTGSSTTDVDSIGVDSLSELKTKYGYNFEGMNPSGNPVTPGADGSIGQIIWQDSTPKGQNRTWMVLQAYNPSGNGAGVAGGLQNGDFSFETAAKKCVMISWDPFGRIFDSKTLEPIMGENVTLYYNPNYNDLSKPQDFIVMPLGSLNPFLTKVDGVFNFIVPDGEYKIKINTGISQALTDLHTNYKKIYEDIYLADIGETTIGGVILEQGGAQHRDVPVPTRNTNTMAEIMEYLPPVQSGGVISVQGRASHAFVKVIPQIERIRTGETTGVIRDAAEYTSTTLADDPFSFSMELDQSQLENTPEYYDILKGFVAEKTDITSILVKKSSGNSLVSFIQTSIDRLLDKFFFVQALTRGKLVALEPIPSYLEGYAYDATKTPIPMATVSIYLKNAQKPYYETQADSDGHYKIGSEFIPPFGYELRYKKVTGESFTVSTPKYIADNHVYQAKNKINPYVFKATTPELIAQQKAIDLSQSNRNSGTPGAANGNGEGQKNGSGSKYVSGGSNKSSTGNTTQTGGGGIGTGMQGIIMIVVVIMVLAMIGAGAFIMMKSKQQQTPPLY